MPNKIPFPKMSGEPRLYRTSESSSDDCDPSKPDDPYENMEEKCLSIGIDVQPRGYALCAILKDFPIITAWNIEKKKKEAIATGTEAVYIDFISIPEGFKTKNVFYPPGLKYEIKVFWMNVLEQIGKLNHKFKIVDVQINIEKSFLNESNIRLEAYIYSEFQLDRCKRIMKKINLNFYENLKGYKVNLYLPRTWMSWFGLQPSKFGKKYYVRGMEEELNKGFGKDRIETLISTERTELHDLVDSYFISVYSPAT